MAGNAIKKWMVSALSLLCEYRMCCSGERGNAGGAEREKEAFTEKIQLLGRLGWRRKKKEGSVD